MDDYEYRGMLAEYWDLLRGDTSRWEDRFFFLEVIIRYGQPVLDVGCGTGRLLLDYAAQGIDLDGVDNSPEMLALLRQRADQLGLPVRVELGLMETLAQPRQYRTILVPSSSFQLVLDPAAAAQAMGRFYAHLLPGGVLAMPFMDLRTPEMTGETYTDPDWFVRAAVRPTDGATVRRSSRSTYDLVDQTESTHDRYEVILNGTVIASQEFTRSPATRWYTQAQARQLYLAAGFNQVQLLRGFTFEPAAPEDKLFTILGIK